MKQDVWHTYNINQLQLPLGGNMRDIKNLCIALAKADTEEEVIGLLKQWGYWDNPEVWRYYGDNENNFAVIGNQQSAPDAALVEKIINSVDAVLMRECLRKGIDPESAKAPRTLNEALENFFNIPNGILSNLSPRKRGELAKNIIVVATGQKSNPCYSIIDKGEGQTPKRMPETFLSLTKSNKLRIPFVQGKFNMGGTGALQFCGKHNLQLIISRRDPQIVKIEGDDGTSEYWGFTIIRREAPTGGMKSSSFKYLAPEGKILMFKADSLPLLPGEYPIAYERPLEWGTFVKLYEYQLMGLKAPVYFDLYYRLAVLLPNIALPVLLYERRKGYKAESYHIVLSGLSVRLEEDKYQNIEPGFPSSATLTIKGQEMKIQIYAFKRDKRKHYAREEGIIFTVNGQAHGFISKSFFTRKSVGMSYLADSILIIADCSAFDGRTREDLFMNSRDRLREGALKKEIEEKLGNLIKNHQGLRELRERRRREEIEGKIGDAKPLVEVLEKVIKNSPALSKLFVEGVKITNPFKLINSGTGKSFKGKQFPTYFKLKKEFTQEKPKHCPINQRFRVQFETDAENDYFTRDTDPGEFKLYLGNEEIITDYVLNLWNGIANLTVKLPEDCKEGDILKYTAEVDDVTRVNPFRTQFYVIVDPPVSKGKGKPGERIKPPGEDKGERKKPSHFDVPNIIEVYRDEWEKYKFDEEAALMIKDTGENGYDFYINMENVYLLTEIKGRTKIDPNILKAQYKYGMVLIGISLVKALEEKEGESVYDKIAEVTKAIAPVLLPMIATLGELGEEQL